MSLHSSPSALGVNTNIPTNSSLLSKHKSRFLSVRPLELDLTVRSSPSVVPSSQVSTNSRKFEDLASKLRRKPRIVKGELDSVVEQINLAHGVQSSGGKLSTSTRRVSASFEDEDSKKKTSSHTSIVQTLLRPSVACASMFSYLFNFQLPGVSTALKDLSATVHQADVRLLQIISAPRQFSTIYEKEQVPPAVARAEYINLYNTIWLIANDMIVGSAISTFLCENHVLISQRLMEVVKVYTIQLIRKTLTWLNEWPAGLKLNYELGSFICEGFLLFTEVWEQLVLAPVGPYLPHIIYFIGVSGVCGATMALSVSSDLLSMFTVHIYVFYYIATTVFNWHLKVINSLFNVFRGKKYNVIRKRVEPADYTLDELLLGTILFTFAAFIFPTVLAYYLVFATARIAIIGLHAMMETFLAFMNHFPLFAVMLRLKDPDRLPGGLKFVLNANLQSFDLKNHPIELSAIFFQHLRLWRRLSAHYSPLYLLRQLFSGGLIFPISKRSLQYPAVSISPKNA
ncbi:Gpi1-domain-containing protein [Atractiella rhizophila]|nr:Gpi1-domain-containing protein [Atractiella rhizophila]